MHGCSNFSNVVRGWQLANKFYRAVDLLTNGPFLGFSKYELNFKKRICTWNGSNILESSDYHTAFMAFISRHNSLMSRQKAWMENHSNRPKL